MLPGAGDEAAAGGGPVSFEALLDSLGSGFSGGASGGALEAASPL